MIDETVKAVATAICRAKRDPNTPDETIERAWTAYCGQARAAITAHLSALQAQGMVIVPKKPTISMVVEGRNGGEVPVDHQGRTDVAAIYRAMITAANPTP